MYSKLSIHDERDDIVDEEESDDTYSEVDEFSKEDDDIESEE
jgi:hypothetical protein